MATTTIHHPCHAVTYPAPAAHLWETTRNSRLLLLYDSRQMVVARARVPLRHMDPDVLAELAYQLEDVFGER
jgi:hypothetical protein